MESKELPWTGERLVPALRGDIALEHLHRYAIATALVDGLDVLDIASGEGYGSQLLALRARSVVGVDIAPEAVRHAQRKYSRANLSFLEGSCTAIPLPDASVDVVVSFETIEHIQEHEQFLAEVMRVLRKGGQLLISTPERSTYDATLTCANPFHQRELTRAEFAAVLRDRFVHVHLLGQRVAHSSVILGNDVGEPRKCGVFTGDFGTVEFSEELPLATYVLAVCSDTPLPAIPVGNFEFKTEPLDSPSPEDACFVQVFADQGAGYTETLSVHQPLIPDVWQTVRFDHLESLHSDPQRKLRIDVVNQPALVEVAGIRVVRGADSAVLYDASSEAEFRRFEHSAGVLNCHEGERLFLLATDGDPQLLLPLLPDFQGAACTLELNVRVTIAVPGLLRRLHELAGEKQTLADLSENLKARTAHSEASAIAWERRHSEAQTAMEAANARTASLAHDLDAARSEIEEHQRTLEAARRETAERQRTLEAARGESAERQRTLEAAHREAAERQRALEAARGESAERQRTLEAARREAAERQQALEAARREAAERQRALEVARGEAAERQRALEAARGESAERQRALEAARGESAEHQRALKVARGEVAEHQQALESVRRDMDERQRALDATRRELEVASGELHGIKSSLLWRLSAPLRCDGRFASRLKRSGAKRLAEIRELLFRIAVRLPWTVNLRRLHWEWKLIRQSGLLDARWYFSRYPDALHGRPDPVLHYLCKGALNGCDPSPLFETRWYLEQNPDVAKAGENPLVHFLRSGGKEGRDPSPLFETRWYLEQNPDVAQAGENPLIHYLRSGGKEGRDPNPFFDSRWYLERNPDVAKAGENPLIHYLRSGGKEGRDPNPFFDSRTYFEQNPDIAKTGENPLVHFLRHGRLEGRASPFPDNGSEQLPEGFNRDLYLMLNPDVAASGIDPIDHYLKHGRLEGRAYGYPVIDLEGTHHFQAGRDSILVVSHEASRTGAPVLTLNIVYHLVGRYNVVVLLLGDGPLTNSFVQAGAAILVSSIIRPSAFLANNVVGRLQEQFNFKFALVNSIESRVVLQPLAMRFVPVVSLIHEFAAYTRPRDAFTEALFWSSEVVFSANVTLQNAIQEVPELDDRSVHILPQGRCLLPKEHVTDEEFEREGARLRRLLRPEGSGDGLVVVLGAGLVQIRKGVDLFIEVAARVVSAPGGGNCRFVWFGNGYNPDSDLHYSVYLGDQIRRAGLGNHVIFARETPAIETAYEETDIFLLSSRLDPLPNVAIDALAHGKPVLCFDRATGIADFLKGHGLGDDCVARYLDTAEMADKILALANSRHLRHEVGEKGRAASASFFNMKEYVAAIEVLARGASDRARREEQDVAVILDSGLFRPDFSLPRYAAQFPLEDAVRLHVRAWSSGVRPRKPFPGFHPGVYLEQHGVAIEGTDPTADYIRAGRPEGSWNSPVIGAGGRGARVLPNNGNIAMHLHVFYPDLLPEITARLSCNQIRPDLFISVTNEEARNLVTGHLKHYEGKVAAIQLVPNRGRDIGPFLTAFGPRILADYDYVGHIHTKKSVDIKDAAFSKAWFDFLLANLLGGDSGSMADTILATISDDRSLGMVFPDDPNVVGWNANKRVAEELAARIGLGKLPRSFDFPVGTMFWGRTAALAPLINLNLQWDDYPAEPLPYDGTLLHAIERLLPLTLSMRNLRAATTNVPGVTR